MATIAALVGKMFEDVEYARPAQAFREAGHEVVVVSKDAGDELEGERRTMKITSQKAVRDVSVGEFDALFIPGGVSPDKLRVNDDVVAFVRDFVNSGKPVFTICHAPQLLISADVLKGRTITGWRSIIPDMRNAGANYLDREVVEDGNIISSRSPADIPAFIGACLKRLGAIRAKEYVPTR